MGGLSAVTSHNYEMTRLVSIPLKKFFYRPGRSILDHKKWNSSTWVRCSFQPTKFFIIAQTFHVKRQCNGNRLIRHPRNLWSAFIGLGRSFFSNRVPRHRLKILVFALWDECPSSEYCCVYFSLSNSSLHCNHRGRSVEKIVLDLESSLNEAVVTVHSVAVYL